MMKKILIIGASSGMGRALALGYLERGDMVTITARRENKLNEIKAKFPENCFLEKMDINDDHNLEEKLERAVRIMDGLDLLILSSGYGEVNEIFGFKIERDTVQTNVIGFLKIVHWAYSFFEFKGKGHLVAITSISGLRGNRSAPAYNATKSFQINYLESLRHRSRKKNPGVVITEIRPGFVDTPMAKGKGVFWMAKLDKATDQIYKAIEKKKKVVYISRRWQLIGILLKIMPRSLYEKL